LLGETEFKLKTDMTDMRCMSDDHLFPGTCERLTTRGDADRDLMMLYCEPCRRHGTTTASDRIGDRIGDQCYPRPGSATLYTVRS